MNHEKYLPIGTVVMLKEGTKRVMITGFCAIADSKKDHIYDYVGCLYPEGILDSKQNCLFNHEQITQIYHLGLNDNENIQFMDKLKKAVDTLSKGTEINE